MTFDIHQWNNYFPSKNVWYYVALNFNDNFIMAVENKRSNQLVFLRNTCQCTKLANFYLFS